MAAEKELTGILFGFHPVEEALLRGDRAIRTLHLSRREGTRTRRLVRLARERGVRVKDSDPPALDRLAGTKNHQGVVAVVEVRRTRSLEDVLDELSGRPSAVLLVLDGVQDPHNLGAVIRNCSLSGADAVVLPKDRTAGITPAVEKVAAGGLEYVPVVRVGNLASALKGLKEAGFWIVGADPGGTEELPGADLGGRVAIVVGEEQRGLRRLTKERCDRLVRIPSTGAVASYNMAVAAGLFLFFAFLRRREDEKNR